jgi:hypothetical protein
LCLYRRFVVSKVAKINDDGTVIATHNPRPVTDDNGIQYPRNIFQLWTDEELNAIGYARFDEENVPSNKRSTGTTDTFANGKVFRSHTTRDYVPPPDPDPTIEDPDTPAYTEEIAAVMEDVPAVMSEDGEEVVTPATTREVTPARTVEHAAGTLPNPEYDYVSLRLRDYPVLDDLIIALWEKVVEDRPDTAVALEVERQAVKAKFPK